MTTDTAKNVKNICHVPKRCINSDAYQHRPQSCQALLIYGVQYLKQKKQNKTTIGHLLSY
jgi:hypothetical protein